MPATLPQVHPASHLKVAGKVSSHPGQKSSFEDETVQLLSNVIKSIKTNYL